jgi:hypothetical protein
MHVFPATTYAAGSNPFPDEETKIIDWNMNDRAICMKHGWWQTGEPTDWTWTHSDFKDVCLPYTQELYKELLIQGKFK